MTSPPDILAGAAKILATSDPFEKARLSHDAHAAWRDAPHVGPPVTPPIQPARPPRPVLAPPREMPRRRGLRTTAGRVALLHALAHIELNAIDLAWDLIARFWQPHFPKQFITDWARVAADEARHFRMLADRLADFGAAYGDLPAHEGLWQAATDTRNDLLARLAVVPLVLEARGLDVTPAMTDRLRAAGDDQSAALLNIIYTEEIAHVAAGNRWFRYFCAEAGHDPKHMYQKSVRRYFHSALKPPFNENARAKAGLPRDFYSELAE